MRKPYTIAGVHYPTQGKLVEAIKVILDTPTPYGQKLTGHAAEIATWLFDNHPSKAKKTLGRFVGFRVIKRGLHAVFLTKDGIQNADFSYDKAFKGKVTQPDLKIAARSAIRPSMIAEKARLFAEHNGCQECGQPIPEDKLVVHHAAPFFFSTILEEFKIELGEVPAIKVDSTVPGQSEHQFADPADEDLFVKIHNGLIDPMLVCHRCHMTLHHGSATDDA